MEHKLFDRQGPAISVVASVPAGTDATPSASVSLAPRGTSGERAGVRGGSMSHRPSSPQPSPPTAGGEGDGTRPSRRHELSQRLMLPSLCVSLRSLRPSPVGFPASGRRHAPSTPADPACNRKHLRNRRTFPTKRRRHPRHGRLLPSVTRRHPSQTMGRQSFSRKHPSPSRNHLTATPGQESSTMEQAT